MGTYSNLSKFLARIILTFIIIGLGAVGMWLFTIPLINAVVWVLVWTVAGILVHLVCVDEGLKHTKP